MRQLGFRVKNIVGQEENFKIQNVFFLTFKSNLKNWGPLSIKGSGHQGDGVIILKVFFFILDIEKMLSMKFQTASGFVLHNIELKSKSRNRSLFSKAGQGRRHLTFFSEKNLSISVFIIQRLT